MAAENPQAADINDILTGDNKTSGEEVKPKFDEELCNDIKKIFQKVLNNTTKYSYSYSKTDLDKFKELFETTSGSNLTEDEKFQFMKFLLSRSYISQSLMLHLQYRKYVFRLRPHSQSSEELTFFVRQSILHENPATQRKV